MELQDVCFELVSHITGSDPPIRYLYRRVKARALETASYFGRQRTSSEDDRISSRTQCVGRIMTFRSCEARYTRLGATIMTKLCDEARIFVMEGSTHDSECTACGRSASRSTTAPRMVSETRDCSHRRPEQEGERRKRHGHPGHGGCTHTHTHTHTRTHSHRHTPINFNTPRTSSAASSSPVASTAHLSAASPLWRPRPRVRTPAPSLVWTRVWWLAWPPVWTCRT